MEREEIGSITIPNYIRTVKLSNAQRPKYYEWNGTTIKAGSKKLLQKYIDKNRKKDIIENNGNVLPQHLAIGYTIIEMKGDKMIRNIKSVILETSSQLSTALNEVSNIGFDIGDKPLTTKQASKPSKFILCKEIDGWYKKVIANPTKVDKPKFHIIKGQDMYVGMNPFIRNKIVTALKDSYYEVFSKLTENDLANIAATLTSNYPLIIEMEICDTIKNRFDRSKKGNGIRWDVGNRADPYMKTFLDFLVNGYVNEYNRYLIPPLIEDDDRLHVSSGNNAYFTPIKEGDVSKLIFRFYKDARKVWEK